MRSGLLAGLVVLGAALTATSASSQIAMVRAVEASTERDWRHERSGMTFPAVLVGAKRDAVQDTTSSEYDVFARYVSEDNATAILIHVYSPAAMSVPLWFDRAHVALALGNGSGPTKPATIFAPPGSKTASAMRVSYENPTNGTAAAVAMVPLGDWLVKISIAGKGSGAEIESRIDQILKAINLPDLPDAPTAVEVQPCGTPLAFSEAKALEPERTRVAAVADMILESQGVSPDKGWCLEGKRDVEWTNYRRAGTSDGYLFALGDNGRGFEVQAVPASGDAKPAEYAVTVIGGDRIVQYPLLSGLPEPQQAADLIGVLQPVASIHRDTKTVELIVGEAQPAVSAGSQ